MCGIFGIVSNEGATQKIVLGLYDLQHRGEQGVGIAVSDRGRLQEYKRMGLVTDVFNEEDRAKIFRKCRGKVGIGHVLYSTIGNNKEKGKQPKALQPLIGDFHGKPFAIGHNGNLIELNALRREVEAKGYKFQSEDSDTEVILGLLSTSQEKDFLGALARILPMLRGSFALILLFEDKVIGIRDKHGIRPLCLGEDKTSFILASEESAFHTMKAELIREVEPGEVVVLGKNGIENSFVWTDKRQLRFCIFEFIYFARPDSRFAGQYVYFYRESAGTEVAVESSSKTSSLVYADIVCSVPDSGEIYNFGVSKALNIPVCKAIFRNRYYATRTFMAPRETNRRELQRMKFYVLKRIVQGKSVIVTEDSILRASVSPEIVDRLRSLGATEIHLMVGSSPIRCPCFLGIDTPTREELVASNLGVEEIRERIVKSDSLNYLSIEGMVRATGLPRENLCLGCFTGDYPVDPPVNL